MIVPPPPTPFEKIYVSPCDILTTPFGSYYRASTGQYEQVRSIQRDGKGTFVIKITKQCPVCGKWYNHAAPDPGYCCPVDELEVYPHIWTKY